MAHELAHVQNRDTLTMTITATLAGAISMLGNFAFFFGGNRDNNNPLGFIGVLVAMIVAPLAAMLVQMAISRTREYSADRRGAEICGNPLSLASALDKIARNVERIHNPDAERNPASAPSLHHQSPFRRAHGQSFLDPSQHREPHRRPTADGGQHGRWHARPRGTASAEAPAAGQPAPSGPWGAPSPKPRTRAPAGKWGRNPTGPKGPGIVTKAERVCQRSPPRHHGAAVSGRRSSPFPACPPARRRRNCLPRSSMRKRRSTD